MNLPMSTAQKAAMKPTRSLIEVPSFVPLGLAAPTWEQRRRMTAAELIKLMGPLHINHPDYQPRLGGMLPMPNLAGRRPVFEGSDETFWSLMRRVLRWVAL